MSFETSLVHVSVTDELQIVVKGKVIPVQAAEAVRVAGG
jgi:hypothetical protein